MAQNPRRLDAAHRQTSRKSKNARDHQPPSVIDAASSTRLRGLFTTFLTLVVHSLIYHRTLYPRRTFLTARAFNLPVQQSRHPGVCRWVVDAVRAVAVQLETASVEQVVFSVHLPKSLDVVERWCFDFGLFPEWEGPDDVMPPLEEGEKPDSGTDTEEQTESSDEEEEIDQAESYGAYNIDDMNHDIDVDIDINADRYIGVDVNVGNDDDIDQDVEDVDEQDDGNSSSEENDEEEGGDYDGEENDEYDEDEDGDYEDYEEESDSGSDSDTGAEEDDNEDDGFPKNDDVNWVDVEEGFRGALRRVAYAAEKMKALPKGSTFTLAVELRDTAPPPIGHPQPWIPIHRCNPRHRYKALKRVKGIEATPIRSVRAGPLFFQCWVEERDVEPPPEPPKAKAAPATSNPSDATSTASTQPNRGKPSDVRAAPPPSTAPIPTITLNGNKLPNATTSYGSKPPPSTAPQRTTSSTSSS